MTFMLKFVVRFTVVVTIMMGMMLPSQAYAKVSSQRWDKTSHILARVSHESGVPVEHLAGFVGAESSFNAKAKNKHSTATGHFGFTKRTWRVTLRSYGHKYGLPTSVRPTDAYANIAMGAEYLKENRRWLAARMHRQVNYKDLYMANLVSPAGVMALERARGHWSAASVLPRAAASNRSLFYYKNGTALSVSAFKQRIYGKYDKQVTAYHSKAKKAYEIYTVKKHDDGGWGKYTTSLSTSPVKCQVDKVVVNVKEFMYPGSGDNSQGRSLLDPPIYADKRRTA